MPKVGSYHMEYGGETPSKKKKAKVSRKPFGFGKKVQRGQKSTPANYGSM